MSTKLAIDWDDRMKPEVLAMRVDLYGTAKNWELMADIAEHLAKSFPDQPQWWVQWAYALRERGLERLGGMRRLPGRLDLSVMIRPCTL